MGAAYVTEREYESDLDFSRNTDDALREGVRDRLVMSPRVRVG